MRVAHLNRITVTEKRRPRRQQPGKYKNALSWFFVALHLFPFNSGDGALQIRQLLLAASSAPSSHPFSSNR
ncbi:hypothetical protein L6164_012307 [Bauhinia variegata]|uniref:Uncharacterized protein n=1 Tax=Bauhinia variegata TaxID=167791 RepID=A0ACB9PET8_BAUVA|nr:hypothetical protein L6164_012307 [Bauhinia variegata]